VSALLRCRGRDRKVDAGHELLPKANELSFWAAESSSCVMDGSRKGWRGRAAYVAVSRVGDQDAR